MFLLDDQVVYGASDLAAAAQCEFALLRELDIQLGRLPRPTQQVDAMLARTAELGDAHEQAYLQVLIDTYGRAASSSTGSGHPGSGGVWTDMAALTYDRPGLDGRRAATITALQAGVDVVYQGSFFDGRFHGRADFIVRSPDGSYTVVDTKLARRTKVTALLQLAGYADQLRLAGIPLTEQVSLFLGSGEFDSFRLSDLLPVYADRRERLQSILDEHHCSGLAAVWGDDRYLSCGRCQTCDAQVQQSRDLLMVAGLRISQRNRLNAVGLTTIDELAAASTAPDTLKMSARTWSKLTQQAQLQVQQRPPGDGPENPVRSLVVDTGPLATLPAPDPGDIFFDFEGDPLWAESGSRDWGLEYLFGVVESPVDGNEPVFRPFWAHNRAEEAQALRDFLDYLAKRREQYPNLHIYHYAPYEKSALLRLATRHHFGEDQVDDLLREGVLVDLYATVRGAIMISQPSYSIKKLEPLYMSSDRSGEVTTAGDSIDVYYQYTRQRQAGNSSAADELIDQIAAYNKYDCLSTLYLRDWLLSQADAAGVTPRGPLPAPKAKSDKVIQTRAETEGVVDTLLARVAESKVSTDQQALRLMAAALGYHQREDKPFWWAHFERLAQPVDEWPEPRDTFISSQGARVLADWAKTAPRQRKVRRTLALHGYLEEGTSLAVDTEMLSVYDPPLADGLDLSSTGFRGTNSGVTIQSIDEDSDGVNVIQIEELAGNAGPFDQLPMALVPSRPIITANLEKAILGLAQELASALPNIPAQPGLDILRLLPPRLTGTAGLRQPSTDSDGYIEAITDSVERLDRSYLAVQGPPGTGKTYVGARVIQRLVKQGWRIGVVAFSHAAVENMLDGIIKAGVPATQVVKNHKDSTSATWTSLETSEYAEFLSEYAGIGCVLGGTAWTFTNHNQVPPGSLDLVVIDEAGQFSLANTLVVSTAAPRLLLLGDPQQLPQVTQGTHPVPVDASALSHLADGHAALPAERGYFLARTWRMHPAVCEPVSQLAYDGKLLSEVGQTTARQLAGVAPGVRTVWVDHTGNSLQSVAEATKVVELVREYLGLTWTDPAESTQPRLTTVADILVVAPYNAQVNLIRKTLKEAGFDRIQVGTVDKFQGKQAPVVILSMTASTPEEVPRGMSFLLSRNRINVAVSRAQWSAVIIRSPALTEYLPTTPENLAELGAFIGLCAQ